MKVEVSELTKNILNYSEVMKKPGLYQVAGDTDSSVILISSTPNYEGKQAPLLWLNINNGTLTIASDGYKDRDFQPFLGKITLSN